MTSMRARLLMVGLLVVAFGCTEGQVATDLEATQALIDRAPEMTPQAAMDDMGLSPERQAELRGALQEIHEQMMKLHAAHPEGLADLDPAQRAELHERLRPGMDRVHDRLEAFSASLTEDERQRFQQHLHRQMRAQHDAPAGAHGAPGS